MVATRWNIDPVAARQADTSLWREIPRWWGVSLNLLPDQKSLRKKWMDYYIGYGGNAIQVGDSGVRIAPIVLEDPIVAKEAIGRDKDLLAVKELKAIAAKRRGKADRQE